MANNDVIEKVTKEMKALLSQGEITPEFLPDEKIAWFFSALKVNEASMGVKVLIPEGIEKFLKAKTQEPAPAPEPAIEELETKKAVADFWGEPEPEPTPEPEP